MIPVCNKSDKSPIIDYKMAFRLNKLLCHQQSFDYFTAIGVAQSW